MARRGPGGRCAYPSDQEVIVAEAAGQMVKDAVQQSDPACF
jgi:hypothetical protein